MSSSSKNNSPISSRPIRILVVDDEPSVRESLGKWFLESGFQVGTAKNAREALEMFEKNTWDVVLLDIRMPGMDGLELQAKIQKKDPDTIIVIITAYASVDTAIRALKQGAFDYITKPFDLQNLEHLIRNAVEQRRLKVENRQLKKKIGELVKTEEIIASSPAMARVLELVNTVAPTDSSVLICGESGTGKELIARAIHARSPRRNMPMITVNCAALPETLLESELFGHERGAFTGAHCRRIGKIELADGGTLFLDEIADISPKAQIDLLRVIETKQFTRLGGNQTIHSDFRLICATNKNLEEEVEKGNFREDLFYRINVFTIEVPPLRERKEDIPLLVHHFINKYRATIRKEITGIDEAAMAYLCSYHWPGNVRELENAIERAMVVGKPPRIVLEDLPVRSAKERKKIIALREVEKNHILDVLNQTGWNITRAAELLEIDRVTLYNKIKRYGLKKRA
jgi:DNA-binding NtrC family response regulator